MRLRRTAVLLTIALLGSLLAVPATAQPDSATLERDLRAAEARLAEIETRVAEAVEDLNLAQVALDEVETELAATSAELDALRAAARELGDAAARHVRHLYRMGPGIELASLFSGGTPTDVGERAVTMQRLLHGQIADLEGLVAARTAVAAAEARLAEQQEQAAERRQQAEAQRVEVERIVASQQAEVDSLNRQLTEARQREEEARRREQERLRAEAESRRRAQAEQARREQLARQRAQQQQPRQQAAPTTSAPSGGGSAAPAARQSAQVAVDAAVSQVGKPYRFGAAGPDAYDCSGLTSWAWRQAGVTIPRTSSQQYAWTKSISRSQLQPGDLIFFGRGRVSHVAMYIGNGRVVEAPYTGNNVRISSTALSRSDIIGYGRV